MASSNNQDRTGQDLSRTDSVPSAAGSSHAAPSPQELSTRRHSNHGATSQSQPQSQPQDRQIRNSSNRQNNSINSNASIAEGHPRKDSGSIFMGLPVPGPESLAVLVAGLKVAKPERIRLHHSIPDPNRKGFENATRREFFEKYFKSTLASIYAVGNGTLPPSCQPSSLGLSWASLKQRGRLMYDRVEVQEFFFGFVDKPTKFDLFSKLPKEIQLSIVEKFLEPRTVEMRLSENQDSNNSNSACFDFYWIGDAVPAPARITKAIWSYFTKGEGAPYQKIFDHEKCRQQTYFNSKLDTLHVPRSWVCIQLYETFWQLNVSCTDKIKKLSILIDYAEDPNIWLQSIAAENTQGDIVASTPLLSFFRGLDHVEFYHQVENMESIDIKNGWHNVHIPAACTFIAGCRFCRPPKETVKTRRGPALPDNPIEDTMKTAAIYLAEIKLLKDKKIEESDRFVEFTSRLPTADESSATRNATASIAVTKSDEPVVERKLPEIESSYAHVVEVFGHETCPAGDDMNSEVEEEEEKCPCGMDHLYDYEYNAILP